MYVEFRKIVQINLVPGRNRDVDIENGHGGHRGERGGGINWEIRLDVNTLPCA